MDLKFQRQDSSLKIDGNACDEIENTFSRKVEKKKKYYVIYLLEIFSCDPMISLI